MHIFKKITLVIALAFAGNAYQSSAQIAVSVKPKRPDYKKATAPSTSAVWIADDWLVKDTSYVWNGDRWAEPPERNVVWVPGRWKHKKTEYIWVPGRWR